MIHLKKANEEGMLCHMCGRDILPSDKVLKYLDEVYCRSCAAKIVDDHKAFVGTKFMRVTAIVSFFAGLAYFKTGGWFPLLALALLEGTGSVVNYAM